MTGARGSFQLPEEEAAGGFSLEGNAEEDIRTHQMLLKRLQNLTEENPAGGE